MAELDPSPTVALRRFLSWSGGGWNSFSTLAGLVAGGLDGLAASGRSSDLATLFAKAEAISANSGGSWFLSALAYSANFLNGLEQPLQRDAFNTTGYNGQVAALFRGVPAAVPSRFQDFVSRLSGLSGSLAAKTKPLFDTVGYYARLSKAVGKTELNWRKIVDTFVYQPYGMTAELGSKGFDAARLSWAANKDLVITTAAQAAETVLKTLTDLPHTKIFASTSPRLTGLPPQGQVTPLSLISQVAKPGENPQASALFTSGDVNFDITSNALSAKSASLHQPVAAKLASSVSVIDATTASSSALALLASPRTFGTNPLTKTLRYETAALMSGMSPLAQVSKGTFSSPQQLPAVPASASLADRMKMYSSSGITKLADGGYTDNTAAAYMVRQIQDRYGSSEPFELTVFVNSSVDPLTGVKMPTGPGSHDISSAWVPRDVALLFGNSDGSRQDASSLPFQSIPVFRPMVPSPKVFDITAWYGETPEWTYAKNSLEMSYYDLAVQTVDNPAFGVRGGQHGRLHLMITNNKSSFAAPVTPAILDQYAQNYSISRDAISTQGGYRFLEEALGLGT